MSIITCGRKIEREYNKQLSIILCAVYLHETQKRLFSMTYFNTILQHYDFGKFAFE